MGPAESALCRFQARWKEVGTYSARGIASGNKDAEFDFSAPDIVVEKIGKKFVDAATIQQIVSGYRQPEFRTILREEVKPQGPESCPEMVFYKGHGLAQEILLASE